MVEMRRKKGCVPGKGNRLYYEEALRAFRMATVKCDVCGGVFSESYLTSHKRLAHSKNDLSSVAAITENEAIRKIASLYESLSVNGRKNIVRPLTAEEQTTTKDHKVQKPQQPRMT